MRIQGAIVCVLLFAAVPWSVLAEGSGTLMNCGSTSTTYPYICTDFSGHCDYGVGIRSNFAAYDATHSSPPEERLYFRVLANEKIYMGFAGNAFQAVFRIKDTLDNIVKAEAALPTSGQTGYILNPQQACIGPNQILPPPANTGYDAIEWTPPAPGTYYIEFAVSASPGVYFSTNIFLWEFDITVFNTVSSQVKPGRLYSKSWQFNTNSNFSGINYILTDDGIVTSLEFNGVLPGIWIQNANQTGCGTTDWITDRKSLFNQRAVVPQYKIFLNSPDPSAFHISPTLGQIVPPAPSANTFCDGHVEFIVNVDLKGNAQIDLTFNPSTYAPRVLNQPVVAGSNTIIWDGLDGNGIQVPNNTGISLNLQYINGLTNLPLYDIEQNTQGFNVKLVSPGGGNLHVYWDDWNIFAGTCACNAGRGPNSLDAISNVSSGGCIPPVGFPACHKWFKYLTWDWGNLNTINSWWYNVSQSQAMTAITQIRTPGILSFVTSPLTFCAGSQPPTVISVTADPNAELYHWSYTGSGVTFTPSATTSSPTVTATFSANATSGNISVHGSNANCNSSPGPDANLAVTVYPQPSITISGPASACEGTTPYVYSTETGMTDYFWVIGNGQIISGGSLTDPTITLKWPFAGTGTVSVNYFDSHGCQAFMGPLYPVTINPLPTPVISGPASPCFQSTATYSAGPSLPNHAYSWTATGGTPASGTGTSFDVTWGNSNPVSVSMQESISYAGGAVCSAIAPAYPVILGPGPDPAGPVSGPSTACRGETKTYSVAPIANAESYTWSYSPSPGITMINNGASADVTFGVSSGSGTLTVQGNKTGCPPGTASPPFTITLSDGPYVALNSCNDPVITTNSRAFNLKGGIPPGGQYYLDGSLVSGGLVNPSSLATGPHQVTYQYTNTDNCTSGSTPYTLNVIAGSNLTNCPAVFTDPRDNKTYRAFSMGNRCWMLDNLAYGIILTPSAVSQSNNCVPEKYCSLSDPACTVNGGFYQWDELMQYQSPAAGSLVQGLCPPEWHVPTQAEWQLLIDNQANAGNGNAGWDLKDLASTNGFQAILSGICFQNNTWDFYSGSLTASMWWTAESSGAFKAVSRGLNSKVHSVSRYFSLRSNALPVRCVRD